MSPLDEVLARRRSRVWTPVALAVSLLIGGLIAWAGFVRFDEVSVAAGEVVPRGNVKIIQHLEGGIIETLNVREGDRVKSGDMLLTLVLGANRLNRQEILVRISSFELRRARLLAEASGAAFDIPAGKDGGFNAVGEAEKRALEARRKELESSISVTGSQIEQTRQAIREQEARARSIDRELALSRRKFAAVNLRCRPISSRMG
jgi:membrane fusion protein, adhesin transport system